MECPYKLRQVTVNKLLKCVLQKLSGDNKVLMEELFSKGIPFHFDTDTGSLVACKSYVLLLNYMTVKASYM